MNDESERSDTKQSGVPTVGPRLELGSVFAGHLIEGVAGSGGMGIVYRTRFLALDQRRALKVIGSDLGPHDDLSERFRREAKTAAAIEHPNIVPVLDAGEESGHPYLAMRMIEGTDLRVLLDDEGRLPPREAISIIGQVASALDAAHASGLVHRDVKPGNILLEAEDRHHHAYLGDFGISKLLGSESQASTRGNFLGTVDYIAPEQASGEAVDHRADIYALACVLFHTLTGVVPFERETPVATLLAHSNAARPSARAIAPELPRGIDRVIERGMSVEPGRRQPSAGTLAAEAKSALDGARVRRVRPAPRPRFSPRLLVALAVAIGVAVAVIALISSGGSSTPGGRQDALAVDHRAAGRVVGMTRVSPHPLDITVGSIKVWTTNGSGQRLDGIDPATSQGAGPPVTLPGSADGVAVGFGSVWVVDRAGDSLQRVDPGQAIAPTSIPVGDSPSQVALDDRWLWVGNQAGRSVSRVDPTPGAANRSISISGAPIDVETGDGATWALTGNGHLIKIDPETGSIVGDVSTGAKQAAALAVGPGAVWVLDRGRSRVLRRDPANLNSVGPPISAGSDPRDLTFGFGSIWIAGGRSGQVTRIAARTGKSIGNPIDTKVEPSKIATGKGAVWVASRVDSKVVRIQP